MDVVLVPSSLTLTSRLFRLTTGGSGEADLLQTTVEWSYSIPPFNRNEFYYRGILTDNTPPLFVSSDAYDEGTALGGREGCYVRQLPGRSPDNPAFEILFNVVDRESLLNLTLSVGSYERFDDILPLTELGGNGGLTIFHSLLLAVSPTFTVTATNLNGLSSHTSCHLAEGRFYDRSPPLARINPVGSVSSHASKILALFVLFDEAGLEQVQEVAVGRLRGVAGDEVLPWTPFNTSLIDTPPSEEDVMSLYSFGRVSYTINNGERGRDGGTCLNIVQLHIYLTIMSLRCI